MIRCGTAVESLNRVHFIPGGNSIPFWTSRGIPHGFIGQNSNVTREFYYLQQIHSHRVLEADESAAPYSSSRPQGDSIVTKASQLKIAVMTADCVPMLIYSPEQVMAVHAGWRGLFAGIIDRALDWFKDKNNVMVGVGPCLSLGGFEVGPEVMDALMGAPLDHSTIPWLVSPGVGDRWHIDLALGAVFFALQQNVPPENIFCMRTCTKEQPGVWHSYRRDGPAAGRNWSWIAKP